MTDLTNFEYDTIPESIYRLYFKTRSLFSSYAY